MWHWASCLTSPSLSFLIWKWLLLWGQWNNDRPGSGCLLHSQYWVNGTCNDCFYCHHTKKKSAWLETTWYVHWLLMLATFLPHPRVSTVLICIHEPASHQRLKGSLDSWEFDSSFHLYLPQVWLSARYTVGAPYLLHKTSNE